MARRVLGVVAWSLAMAVSLSIAHAEEPAGEPMPEAPEVLAPTLLDLETAQRIAIRKNPSLRAFDDRIASVRQVILQERAQYFPQIDLNYTATHTALSENSTGGFSGAGGGFGGTSALGPSLGASGVGALGGTGGFSGGATTGGTGVGDSIDSFRGSIDFSYAVFPGLFWRKATDIARAAKREVEAGQLDATRLILDAIADAFYGVQLARENLAISEADKAFNERLLTEAKARRRVGAGSLSDTLNFEVQVRAAQSARLAAELQLKQSRVALGALMGLPEAKLPDDTRVVELGEDSEAVLTKVDEEAQVEVALQLRPDIRQNELTIERFGDTVVERKLQYLPQVRAIASAEASRTGDSRFSGDDTNLTVGIRVDYSLFSGGRRRAFVAEAKALKREAEKQLHDVTLNAAADVRRAAIEVENAQADYLLQRETAEFVERTRDLVEKEYNAGQGALARLNQAQRDLVAAQGRLAQARVMLRSAWHGLRTATAETLTQFEDVLAELPSESVDY